MNETTIERREAETPEQHRRLHVWGASGERRFELEIAKVVPRSADFGKPYTPSAKCAVRWNANRGAGWLVGWRRTFANETEARAFAASKLATLTGWVAS